MLEFVIMPMQQTDLVDSWAAIVNAAHDITILIDFDGTIRKVSASVQTLLGRSPEELIGTNGVDLAHPDDVATVFVALAENIEGMNATRVETRFLHADGSYVTFEIVGSRLVSQDGADGLVIGCRDMAGRERANLDDPAERHLLHTVLHEVAEGVIATNSTGEVMLMNRAMYDMLHLPVGSVAYSRWPTDVVFVDPESGIELTGAEHPLTKLVDGCPVRDQHLVLRRADRSELRVLARGRSLQLVQGESLGFVLALQDVSEQYATTTALEFRALHDPLTGLPNRRLLHDRLQHALVRSSREKTFTAVLFCDLDDFKAVNDRIGHRAGDDLLIRVAEVIKATMRSGDTLARLGGDEFVLVCEVRRPQDARTVADEVAKALNSPIEVDGLRLTVSASVGVAVGEGILDPASLLRDADMAMYAAKQMGRGRVAMYDERINSNMRRRLATDELLAQLLDAGRLEARYQPIVSVSTGLIVGLEALARLRLDDGSLAPACDFIETAELTGLIGEIDLWMFEESCRASAAMGHRLDERCPMIACNVSARELARPDFDEAILRRVRLSGASPQRMCLEITETSAIQVNSVTIRSLANLRAEGMHIALDDLGAGNSTLRLLRDLPFSIAKIDKSFTDQLHKDQADKIIVRALVQMGHEFGMQVLAEGVETRAQLRAATDAACDLYQGYLFSAAVGLDDAIDMIEKQPAA